MPFSVLITQYLIIFVTKPYGPMYLCLQKRSENGAVCAFHLSTEHLRKANGDVIEKGWLPF